ncbi:hypothetical protein K493DRAFT_87806 [Basidiobolus meristosporus CBS 931.73]|uniref:DET1- and DDB1-associated protein 1 domain-containing protein n=1 Tax=Basidiobolus meristosporus CBS 931.73 TaxID=1314790 RepID=A0A1Y1YVN3_9FUNG|nr:hypothetical protein K493DRAFT_87806 [Basidiobolus meristosporus CBS 931.73]|eukprot:ORY02009.1 hypothetical protein K493DRAFT_87806 [Basidiobolus meristosporus CBS 931.73]
MEYLTKLPSQDSRNFSSMSGDQKLQTRFSVLIPTEDTAPASHQVIATSSGNVLLRFLYKKFTELSEKKKNEQAEESLKRNSEHLDIEADEQRKVTKTE